MFKKLIKEKETPPPSNFTLGTLAQKKFSV